MKNLLLSTLLIFCLCTTSVAQDLMVMKDATEMEVKITEIREREIAYKKWNFQEGPTYIVAKNKVLFVKYSNGTKEVFNTTSTDSSNSIKSSFINGERPYIKGVVFNCYSELGAVFSVYEVAPTFDMVLGARIYDYGFVGFGFGFGALWEHSSGYHQFGCFMVPLYGNLRGFFPVNKDFSPYIDFAVGANLLPVEGFYLAPARIKLGAGFEYKRLVFGIGYDVTTLGFLNAHMGYIKIGVKIGKMRK